MKNILFLFETTYWHRLLKTHKIALKTLALFEFARKPFALA